MGDVGDIDLKRGSFQVICVLSFIIYFDIQVGIGSSNQTPLQGGSGREGGAFDSRTPLTRTYKKLDMKNEELVFQL